MTSISTPHICVQIHYQTLIRYRLWGNFYISLMLSPQKQFSVGKFPGEEVPPWLSFQGCWGGGRSSSQQGGSARRCHLCLAGMPEPEPEPDILDPKSSAGAGALSKPHKEGEMVNSIMGKQKCFIFLSLYGWLS